MSSSAERDSQFAAWQPQYQAAMAETDPRHLPGLVASAEAAIFFRSQFIAGQPGFTEEREALAAALHAIVTVQVEKLNYPNTVLTALNHKLISVPLSWHEKRPSRKKTAK